MEHRFRRKWFENTFFCIAVVKLDCTALARSRGRFCILYRSTNDPTNRHMGMIAVPGGYLDQVMVKFTF